MLVVAPASIVALRACGWLRKNADPLNMSAAKPAAIGVAMLVPVTESQPGQNVSGARM